MLIGLGGPALSSYYSFPYLLPFSISEKAPNVLEQCYSMIKSTEAEIDLLISIRDKEPRVAEAM